VHDVTIRELRNHGGRVIDRVVGGETVRVTRDGHPVALLRPLDAPALDRDELVRRRRLLPPLDLERRRRDLDAVIDPLL
jgi:prevent-host-death family protein